MILVLFAGAPQAAAPSPSTGDEVLSSATLTYVGGSTTVTASRVKIINRTAAQIEFLQYAPGSSLAKDLAINATECQQTKLPTPKTLEAPPQKLAEPILPLAPVRQYKAGEAVFVRVIDADQNIDDNQIDRLHIELSVTATGESEILQVTETTPTSGEFIGYMQSQSGSAQALDCQLTVTNNDELQASYTDFYDNQDVASSTVMVDPFGLVFDAGTGNALDGAIITLMDSATDQPATVLGDDLSSAYPSTVTSGAQVTDTGGTVYDQPQGQYRFPYVAPGDYYLLVTPPSGYSFPSNRNNDELQQLDGAPFALVTGSRGEVFNVPYGPALQLDLPLEPSVGSVYLNKTASHTVAAIGEFVQYTVTMENPNAAALSGITLQDLLPPGFRYQQDSAKLDDAPITPQIDDSGRGLTFTIGDLTADTTLRLQYVVQVGVDAVAGPALNTIQGQDADGRMSNIAQATVLIKEELFADKATIVGRVSLGPCHRGGQDEQQGAAGVRIYMEDGRYVETDARGLYHFEAVNPGSHLLQVDPESLGENQRISDCTPNSRFAGTPGSQFVDLQGGSLWRADFYLDELEAESAETDSPSPPQETAKPEIIYGPPLLQEAPQPEEIVGPPRPQEKDTQMESKTGEESHGPQMGILNLRGGDRVIRYLGAVRVRLPKGLKPKLTLDGERIANERIGFTMEEEGGTVLYSYIGVELGDAGDHKLSLEGVGPFGNARFEHSLDVYRTDILSKIMITDAGEHIADGKTPIKLRVRLEDRKGYRISGSAELQLKSSKLTPVRFEDAQQTDPALVENGLIRVDRDGLLQLAPVSQSGVYEGVLSYNDVQQPFQVHVKPDMRDEWLLVGLAEGTFAHNTLSGNMEALGENGLSDDIYQEGRLAFYAKGRVKGEWLLTVAYDSSKDVDRQNIYQQVTPDAYYTLYGDTSEQRFDAASREKLYLRIEREHFHALFGDFNTGMSVTELGRYERNMTGFKTEYQDERLGLSGFVTQSGQKAVRDEIQGDGTSGLYQLTRRNIQVNSEQIRIETRDRYHSETILSTQALTRGIDYTIDYLAGTLFFKQPVHAYGEGFNPVFIVVDYEAESSDGDALIAGGRASVKLLDDKLELGAGAVHDHSAGNPATLYSADTRIALGERTELRAEAAESERQDTLGENTKARAYLAEINHHGEQVQGRAYIRRQQNDFGIGQHAVSESGSHKYGGELNYLFNDHWGIELDASHEEIIRNDASRDLASARTSYTEDDYSLWGGAKSASDSGPSGNFDSTLATAGAKRHLLDKDLTLRLDLEQALGDAENAAYPSRYLTGVDYRLTPRIKLFTEHEITEGENLSGTATRLGAQTTPWQRATLNSSIEQRMNEYGPRRFAVLGFNQSIPITEALSLEFGVDRSHTLVDKSYAPSDIEQQQPTLRSDYTAFSAGLNYKAELWSASTRMERLTSEEHDKNTLMAGLFRQQTPGLGLSARSQNYRYDYRSGERKDASELNLALAYRPPGSPLIVLERLDWINEYNDHPDTGDIDTAKLINNLNTNWLLNEHNEMSLHHGIKQVRQQFAQDRYNGITQLLGLGYRYDINPRWDIGLQGSTLQQQDMDAHKYSWGLSVGVNLEKNLWMSTGYNLHGFRDNDFRGANYTAQGWYIKMRIALEQSTIKQMLGW